MIYGLVVFFVAFGFYLKTLCPAVFFGDSGELIAAIYTLGIPHPTGYPLYCLLGKLFTFIPLGSIAFKTNLMSAFFAAATVWLLYIIINQLTKNLAIALSSSLVFAFLGLFWSQATIAEVYTLLTFFFVAIIAIVLYWHKTKNSNWLYLLAFVYGLSLTHHRATILLLPALMILFWQNRSSIVLNFKTVLFFLR